MATDDFANVPVVNPFHSLDQMGHSTTLRTGDDRQTFVVRHFRRLYHRALDLYATSRIDFEDALAVAHMERLGITEILSYDAHFDRIEGIERREP